MGERCPAQVPEQAPKWWWLSHQDGSPFPFTVPPPSCPSLPFAMPCPCALAHSTSHSSHSLPCLSLRGPWSAPAPAQPQPSPRWKPLLTETGTHRGILRGLRKKFPQCPSLSYFPGEGRQQLWLSLVPAPAQEAWPWLEDKVKAEVGAHHGGPAGPWRAVPLGHPCQRLHSQWLRCSQQSSGCSALFSWGSHWCCEVALGGGSRKGGKDTHSCTKLWKKDCISERRRSLT